MKVKVRKLWEHWYIDCEKCGWAGKRNNWFDANWLARYHAETHKEYGDKE